MQKERWRIKERKRKKETMTSGYYIHERSPELVAVERWENEGGGLGLKREYFLDAVREDYRHGRYMDQVMPFGKLEKHDALNKPESITRWIPVVEQNQLVG